MTVRGISSYVTINSESHCTQRLRTVRAGSAGYVGRVAHRRGARASQSDCGSIFAQAVNVGIVGMADWVSSIFASV